MCVRGERKKKKKSLKEKRKGTNKKKKKVFDKPRFSLLAFTYYNTINPHTYQSHFFFIEKKKSYNY